jgi:hypothetical protein
VAWALRWKPRPSDTHLGRCRVGVEHDCALVSWPGAKVAPTSGAPPSGRWPLTAAAAGGEMARRREGTGIVYGFVVGPSSWAGGA